MDLLARHKREPRLLVVELKKDQAPDATVGQLLRYMGWVKKHRAEEEQTVHGLIISKNATLEILYALECVPNVELMRYSEEIGVLKLKTTNLSSSWQIDLTEMSPEEARKRLQELKIL